MSARRSSAASTRSAKSAAAAVSSRRKLMVLGGLVGGLTVTSLLMMAISPQPLAPGAYSSLFALGTPESWDALFDVKAPVQSRRWKAIYVHHSRTAAGDAVSLAQSTGLGDHFLIGNGDGCDDGEIQMSQRWNQQLAALPPEGADSIESDCISICLVGDFDRTAPTPVQMRRVGQLVSTLQSRLGIPADRVLLLDKPQNTAAAGRYFPVLALREQLLP